MAKHVNERVTQSFSRTSLFTTTPHGAWTPNTDVFETPELLVVRMEIAGVNREDLEIRLDDRMLIVRGDRKDLPYKSRGCYRQVEIDHGDFERRIVLPCRVDAQKAHAHLEDGFLQIELPKARQPQTPVVNLIIELIG
jgi:HSP20 family protein